MFDRIAGQPMLVVILLAGNTLLAAGYLVIGLARGRQPAAYTLTRAAILFLCPVVAPLCFLLGRLMMPLLSRGSDNIEQQFAKDKRTAIAVPDAERDLNYVPIGEALAVGNAADTRALLLNVLGAGVGNTLPSIAQALRSEDTETSHYAATIVMDALSSFRSRRIELEAELQRQPDDPALLAALCTHLYEGISQHILDDIERHACVMLLDATQSRLYAVEPERVDAAWYGRIIELLLTGDEADAANVWIAHTQAQFPDSVNAYKAALTAAYYAHDRERFTHLIAELRRSSIDIDSELLELIRVLNVTGRSGA